MSYQYMDHKFLDHNFFGTSNGQLVNEMNDKCMMYHSDDVSNRKIHEKVHISNDVWFILKNSCHDHGIRDKGTNKQFQHLIDILHMIKI